MIQVVASKLLLGVVAALIAEFASRRWFTRPSASLIAWIAAALVLLIPPLVDVPLATGAQPLLSEARGATSQNLPVWPEYLALIVWLAGAIVLALRQLRAMKLTGHLVQAAENPPIQIERTYARIQQGMELKEAPRLRIANAHFSPFLWHPSGGRAYIVIPQALAESLSEIALEAVLRHEIAHFRRRDARIYAFGALLSTAWWWCPLSWLIRRRLGEFQELCADQAALKDAPELRHAYARALLDTEQFVAGREERASPAAAPSLLGRMTLRRRIEFVLQCDAGGDTSYWRAQILAPLLALSGLFVAVQETSQSRPTPYLRVSPEPVIRMEHGHDRRYGLSLSDPAPYLQAGVLGEILPAPVVRIKNGHARR